MSALCADLSRARRIERAHLLQDVPARAFDMAGDCLGGLLGILRTDMIDEFAMFAHYAGPTVGSRSSRGLSDIANELRQIMCDPHALTRYP